MQARSRLYARRLKGDLDLGLEPSRVDPGRDRRWAEIITPGGLLPEGTEQDILVQTEDPNYRIGTRRVIDDRVFRYCHADEELYAQSGCFVDRQNYWEGRGTMPVDAAGNHLATRIPAGTETIYFDNQEAIGVDDLADGWIAGVGDDATSIFCMRIKSNEASTGVGGTTLITLYRGMPLGQERTINHRCYVYVNQYSHIHNTGGAGIATGLAGAVCVPLIKVLAATPYFWGLTWGIFYGLCGTYGNMIATRNNEREFWFDYIGAMVHRPGNPGGDPWFQRGGFLLMDGNMAQTTAVTWGDQLAMLQISP